MSKIEEFLNNYEQFKADVSLQMNGQICNLPEEKKQELYRLAQDFAEMQTYNESVFFVRHIIGFSATKSMMNRAYNELKEQ